MHALKNKFFVLIALIFLAALTWFLKAREKSASVSYKSFAVTDTGAIDKIFLADKAGNQLLIERHGAGEWLVNKQFLARRDVIQNLLLTILTIAVKMPVPLAAHNYVIAQLAATGIKTELYAKEKLLKTYYVGGPTQDLLGTYMLQENSDRAFVMHIPGFNGYLCTRYSPLEENWKERFVFKASPGTIESIEINYPQSLLSSFNLNLKTGTVKSGVDNRSGTLPSSVIVKYSKLFEYTAFEGWVTNFSSLQQDSLRKGNPLAVIRVVATNGEVKILRLFPIAKDPARMYALTRDSTLLLVQHFVLDSILLRYPQIPGLRENIYQQRK